MRRGAGRRYFFCPAGGLRRITAAPADGLRLISFIGDSMAPTLEHGDMVMVDTNRTSPLASQHFRP
jgi:phage repressor protein C with HTH and peptisase S24 domain